MAEGKSGGRKSPVDRSDKAADFPSTVVKNVQKGEQLDPGGREAKVGKTGSK